MSCRTGVATRPAILAAGVVAVCVAAALILIMQRRTVATPAQIGVVLKCAKCGEILRTNAQFIAQHAKRFYPDPLTPGVTCPKCGDDALVQAFECPSDHAIFYAHHLPASPAAVPVNQDETSPIDRTPILCPTCQWDPLAAQREQMLKH